VARQWACCGSDGERSGGARETERPDHKLHQVEEMVRESHPIASSEDDTADESEGAEPTFAPGSQTAEVVSEYVQEECLDHEFADATQESHRIETDRLYSWLQRV
jgi:hypothetical protein